MTDDQTIQTLARLELGFRTDAERLKELEEELAKTLAHVRQFGRAHGARPEWNLVWDRQWDEAKSILEHLNSEVSAMSRAVASSDLDRFERATQSWKNI